MVKEQNAVVGEMIGWVNRNHFATAWGQFSQGDTDAIMRVAHRELFRHVSRDPSARIGDVRLSENNAVDRFIRNFEFLLNEAEKCDSELRRLFELSSMGTVYAGLCLLTDHPQAFEYRYKMNSLEEVTLGGIRRP